MAEDKTSLGLPKNTTAALAYSLGWVTGLVVYFVEKNDKSLRFHALQSIILFGAIHLLSYVTAPVFYFSFGLFSVVYRIISLAVVALWVFLLVKTYRGEKIKLPVIGNFVEKQLEK
ncbi:MAG: Chloroplast import component protein (Tic20) [Microgenomates group bacterium ADurb.Bin219]|nr:MAG: Chloroplast import component protein (Tic20) [Microgenomates group bacterium ADurb.Bin219]HNP89015.1 hypothetical protein [Candidatus Woesebacteria bacterium]